MDEDPPSLEINLPAFGDHAAVDATPWPEGVPHRSPGVFRIGAEEGFAVFTDLKARGLFRHGEVYDTILVDDGFDSICRASVIESDGTTVGVEREFVGVEAMAFYGIGAPEMRGLFIGVEDLGVELAGCVDAPIVEL